MVDCASALHLGICGTEPRFKAVVSVVHRWNRLLDAPGTKRFRLQMKAIQQRLLFEATKRKCQQPDRGSNDDGEHQVPQRIKLQQQPTAGGRGFHIADCIRAG